MIEFHVLATTSLRGADGTELGSFLTGSKRVGLLSYLALARPRGFHRRDTLLALFWPDRDDKHARASLRNMLYQMRRSLGSGVIAGRGDDEIGLSRGSLRCDAVMFEQALDEGRLAEALDLYRGDLLEGFHVAGAAPEFGRWLDNERARLSRRAAASAAALVQEAEEAGDWNGAIRWARRAADFDSYDEGGARRLVSLLDRAGDRAGALRTYDEFAERLDHEFGAEPSAKTRELIDTIRRRDETRTTAAPISDGPNDDPESPVARPAAVEAPGAESQPPQPAHRRHRGRAALAAGLALLVTAVAAAVLVGMPGSTEPNATTIAVGEIRGFGERGEPAPNTSVLGTMGPLLATNLARVPELRVLSIGRLYELASPAAGERGALQRAARQAGAGEILEGTLSAGVDGRLRLDLQRIDLGSGMVRDAYQVDGATPYEIVDRTTTLVLEDFDLTAPALGIASVTTSSLVAYRFYEEGLRAFYDGDARGADRLLSAALAEDTTFAMAAYYRARTQETADHARFRRDLGRAMRHAEQASGREQLLIRTAWAREMDEPRQLALAESLVTRYPAEPDGHLFLGEARLWSGDFMAALPHLRRVVAMDSASLTGEEPHCHACDALVNIVTVYLLADSLPAAEREARRWVDMQRGSARAWQTFARTLEYQSRTEEARVARSVASSLGSDNPRDAIFPAVLALRDGDFAAAARLLTELEDDPAPLVRQNVLWYRVLSYRGQRRWDEALAAAREYRHMLEREAETGSPPVWAPVLEAQVLLEMGRPHEAAVLWREMGAAPYEPDSPARSARHRAWTLTQAAAAHAAAGDTALLTPLADSIEAFGDRSAYGRDARLHHYVRGLLHAARRDTAAAADHYRGAVFSLTAGYGRVNLELARSLLALEQPREAITVLRGALRGPLDAGNLYVNRADIHALLARSYRATGQPDSAAAHAVWGRD